MVSNDIVMPLVLQRREALITGREQRRLAAAHGAPARDLRHPAARLHVLPHRRRRAARLHRPAVVRRHRAARAGVFRRPDLAARHRARRHRRHDRRHPGLGLYAAAAELRRHRHRRPAHPHRRPVAHRRAAAADICFGLDLPPLVHGVLWSLAAQPRLLCRLLAAPRALVDRAPAGRRVRAVGSGADDAELPALALVGDGRGTDHDGRPLSRRRAHPPVVRKLRRHSPHQPRSQGRGRFPAGALRRAHARLRHRRGLVAPGAVAAAAQAHGLDQGRAQAARRRQCRDPVQPRNPADRARPRAPGHRGVRQGPATDLLEPAVRRDPRSAAKPDPRRQRARRHPALQRPAQRRRAPSESTSSCARRSNATCPAASRSSSASPSPAW